MNFPTLVLRNMRRRPLRVALTITAMAVAVMTFVALVGIAQGVKRSALESYKLVGVDLVVVRAGGQERLNSALDYGLKDELAELPGVRRVAGSLADVISFERYGVYGAAVQGFEPNSPLLDTLGVVRGRALGPEDHGKVLLGSIMAANLGKTVGNEIVLYEDETVQVVGIYTSYNVLLDGMMVMLLADLQRLMDRPGQVTGFGISVEDPTDPAAMMRIERAVAGLGHGLEAMPVRDHVETLTQFRISMAMSWLTAAIAMVIGALSMMNTMFMAVLERTREIGILRATGWRTGRVVRMVLGESAVMSLAAAALGSLAAVAVVRLLVHAPLVNGLVDGRVPWPVIAQGFVMAVAVGLAGAAYPAYRSAKLRPIEALRHE